MPLPVKISDRLVALARDEARNAHRSTTAQIEHWATLGRAVETMVAYRDMLALKRVGPTLPIPAHVTPAELEGILTALVTDADRASVKVRIGGGAPVYTSDPRYPGMVVEVQPDGTRTPGMLKGRRFIAAAPGTGGRTAAARRVAARRVAARRRPSTRPGRPRSGG